MRCTHLPCRPLIIVASLIACAAIISHAGDLSPPPGPIAPAMKALDQVEPRIALSQATTPGDADSVFKITQPGSYYLTERLNLAPNKHGIEIAAAAVTLDLNGFSLTGGTDSLNAIEVSASVPINLTVRNGMIDSWNGYGVSAPNIFDIRIENLSISFCQDRGIKTGDGAHISNCVVTLCRGGIETGHDSLIDNCQAIQTIDGTGIQAGEGCIITSCLASRGTRTGFIVSAGTILEDCTARQNDRDGFSTFGASLRGCTARGNAEYGFVANTSNLTNCIATGNTDGGIDSTQSVIQFCNASFNQGMGIATDNGLILSNLCNSNSSTGIITFPFSNDSRIEDNHCNDNEYGMFIGTAGNLIVGNSASGNEINYSVVANNKVGTVVTAPNSAAINGSSGGAGVGSSNPWANLSY